MERFTIIDFIARVRFDLNAEQHRQSIYRGASRTKQKPESSTKHLTHCGYDLEGKGILLLPTSLVLVFVARKACTIKCRE